METDKRVEYTLHECHSCHFRTFEKNLYLIWASTHHINNAVEYTEHEWCISVCHVCSAKVRLIVEPPLDIRPLQLSQCEYCRRLILDAEEWLVCAEPLHQEEFEDWPMHLACEKCANEIMLKTEESLHLEST